MRSATMAFTPKPLIRFDEEDPPAKRRTETLGEDMVLSAVHRGDYAVVKTPSGLIFQRCGGGRRVIRKSRGNY